MTRDDIIRMAREAEFHPMAGGIVEGNLLRFASLVAAAEREACAKLVEPTEEHRRDARWGYLGGMEGVELLDSIVADIRARGQE